MKFILATTILALATSPVFGGAIEARQINTACNVTPGNLAGVCLPTASCRGSGGQSRPGFCPGPTDIQCCIKADCSGSRSACLWTSQGCPGGRFLTGLCPGPTGFRCCRLN